MAATLLITISMLWRYRSVSTPYYFILPALSVMRDPSRISRGSGFVAFSTSEETSRAGSLFVWVCICGKKRGEQSYRHSFSQMRPVPMVQPIAPRMPMYTPSAPGPGQQLFYGQAPPAIIPPQAGFGYQQQLVPGMRPGAAPMPNFYMPLVHQGQQGQQPGGNGGRPCATGLAAFANDAAADDA